MNAERMAVRETELRFELMQILDQLNADERAVVLGASVMLARRIRSGRERYAPLNLANDGRDWEKEALEELVDGAAYLMCASVQRARRGQ